VSSREVSKYILSHPGLTYKFLDFINICLSNQ
jgi:hypothetical protein